MNITMDWSASGGTDVAASASAAADKQTFGAQVVSETLDVMNSDPMSASSNADYNFQKNVLSAVYTGTGTILDSMG